MTRLPSLRNQVVLLALALVAALGVVGAIGWVSWSARAAALVSTSWQLDCPGTRVGDHQGDPAVWSRPGWHCEVDVRVVNDGDQAVRVTGLTARKVGPAGDLEARALPSDSIALQQGTTGPDGAWTADVTVPAHAARTLTVAVGWRREGCNTAGDVSLRPWATVRFETLQREHEVTSAQPFVLRTFDDAHDERACPAE